MPQKSARRKANHRKQPAAPAGSATTTTDGSDPLHNRDHPCSKRLQSIAERIFDKSSEDAFSVLVRDYLLTSVGNQQQSPAKKKKRRKKKKNKGPTDGPGDETLNEGADSLEASPTTALVGDLSAEAVDHDESQMAASGMCLPRERLEFLWNDYLLRDTFDSEALQRSREALDSVASRFSAQPMHESLVDSVARPFMRQEMIERRMDRILAAFMQRFTPSDKATSATDRLGDFLEHCCSDTDHPFFVPLKLVEEAIGEVGCPACRRDVQRVLEQSHTTRQMDLDGAMFETVMDDYEKNDYELDSMYQIMEEGSLPLRDLPKWKFEAAERNDEKGWRLVRPLDIQTQWSVSDLKFLFKHGLLAMGLPDDELFPPMKADTASDVAVASVDHQITDLQARLDRIECWVKEAGEKVHEGKPTNEVMDLDSFDHLKQADEKCDLVLNDLLGIAIKVTNAVSYVQAHYGCNLFQERLEIEANVFWATRQCYLLWETFLDGVDKIMEQMNIYEAARFAIADHRGCLEEMYVSLEGRRLYFDYVRQKVRFVASAASMIKDRLFYPTQLGNNSAQTESTPVEFMIRLFMEEAYFRSSQSRQPHIQLDQAFADLMTVLREVVETAHGPSIERIVRENHIRWSKLWRVADGIQESILKAKEILRKRDHSESYEKKLHETNRQLTECLEASRMCDAESDWERVCAWRKETCHAFKSVIRSWSTLATFAIDDGPQVALSVISRSGLESLLSKSHLDAVFNRFGQCRGGKGASRFVACLVSVTFELTMEKFQEYQSEIAMQELLHDAEKKVEAQKITKKKKRKESTEIRSAQKHVFEGPESSSQAGNSVVSLDPSTSSQNMACEAPPSKIEARVPTSNVPSVMDEIGIYDGSVFIPAETFLLGRLDALLKSEDDIVFVS